MKTNFSKLILLVLISISATAALYTRNTKQFNNESAILLEDIEASSCSLNDLLEYLFSSDDPTYWRWVHYSTEKERTFYEPAEGNPAEIDLILLDRINKYGNSNVKIISKYEVNGRKNIWHATIQIDTKGTYHSFGWESTTQETIYLEKDKDVDWHFWTPQCSEWYQNEPELFKS